jgi:hypothetical protein
MALPNYWNEIRNLKGRTLKTLDRRKPFQVDHGSLLFLL